MIGTIPPLVGPDLSDGGLAVYFVRTNAFPLVKVGVAKNWRVRCREHQCGNPFPLSVLLVAKGCRNAEIMAHGALAESGFRSEWYNLDSRVLSFIDRVIATDGDIRTVSDQFIAERRQRHLNRIAKAEELYAADQIIATVLPLSSAGGAA